VIEQILKQIELITNWENEINWDQKPWYLKLLIENTSLIFSYHLEKNYETKHQGSVDHIEVMKTRANSNINDTYWMDVNKIFNTMLKNLRKFTSHIVITGSLADGEVIKGWSDIDCIIALKDSVMINPNILLDAVYEIRKFKNNFKKIDPLSHHAFFILNEGSLTGRDVNLFPLGIFDSALLLHGDCQLHLRRPAKITEPYYRLEQEKVFLKEVISNQEMRHHSRNGVSLKIPFNYNEEQMYQLKYLVGKILLLPCYVAKMKGIDMGKRRSFDFVYSENIFKDELLYFENIRRSFVNRTSEYERINLIPKFIKSDEFIKNLDAVIKRI